MRSSFQCCHNCHLLVIAIIWKKNIYFFLLINFDFPFGFGIWAISLSFSKQVSQVCQKCILRAQMRKFRAMNFWKKMILIHFLELEQKNFRLLLGNFGKKLKTSSFASSRTHTRHLFEGKVETFVFRVFDEIFGTIAKKVMQVYQNCRNCPEERIEEKSFLTEKLTISSSFWWNSFLTSCAKDRQNCQDCNLCSLGRFWGRTLFDFLHNVSNFSNFQLKNKSKCSHQGCHNCHPGIQRNYLMNFFLLFVS